MLLSLRGPGGWEGTKALPMSYKGQPNNGVGQQDQWEESFRNQGDKILSHPGGLEGQRLEKGLERPVYTLLKRLMSEQFLLIPGPEEVGGSLSKKDTRNLRRKTPSPH